MQSYSLILVNLLTISILFLSNALHAQNNPHNFTCLDIQSTGTVKLLLLEQETKTKRIAEYQRSALKYVLYEGVSTKECGNMKPLLSNEEARKNFQSIEQTFFSKRKGSYHNYIRMLDEGNQLIFIVNRSNLLSYLQEQNIITRLSNGF